MKENLRPIFVGGNSAEANFVLHRRQYDYDSDDCSVAKVIIRNKIMNQLQILYDTRRTDDMTKNFKTALKCYLDSIGDVDNIDSLRGIEGAAAEVFGNALIKYKIDIFEYVQKYYRCFMGRKSVPLYPDFIINNSFVPLYF